MIVSQYPHFSHSADGKSKRNMLQVEIEEPEMKNGFPKDGSVVIRLQDDLSQKAFKMTPQETYTLANELMEISREQLRTKREMWKSRAAPPKIVNP